MSQSSHINSLPEIHEKISQSRKKVKNQTAKAHTRVLKSPIWQDDIALSNYGYREAVTNLNGNPIIDS